MNVRVIKGWRKFTADEYAGRDRAPVFDFTELLKAWK